MIADDNGKNSPHNCKVKLEMDFIININKNDLRWIRLKTE